MQSDPLTKGVCATDARMYQMVLFQRISGAVVSDTYAGCCDMTGSFGYEKEHAELSIKITQQRLLLALYQTPTAGIVVSNGFSCRHQIADLTRYRPIHAA